MKKKKNKTASHGVFFFHFHSMQAHWRHIPLEISLESESIRRTLQFLQTVVSCEKQNTVWQNCLTFIFRTGNIWLGYHEPDPEHYTNIRVWSDCTVSAVSSNWDASFPPSTDVTDDNLCVVMNTANLKWRTVQCNESHSLVCVQETIPGTWVLHGIYNFPDNLITSRSEFIHCVCNFGVDVL